MNPFLNPITGIPFLKNFFFDYKRLNKLKSKDVEKFRDKAFKKIVKYSYTIPLYHKKYKNAGIHPNDISGIKDITKLPFITKKDLVGHFPNGVLPLGYNKKKIFVTSTSGSTGKPLLFYVDFSVLSVISSISRRSFEYFNLNWKKSRISHIGNYSFSKPDSVFQNAFISKVKFLSLGNNYQSLNAFSPMKDIIKKLSDFEPEMIYSYPTTFKHLAYYKKNGGLDKVNPKLLYVSGAVTDDYTRSYVEEAFGCKMHNIYTSAEAAGEIAFECEKGNWHLNYDHFHLEGIDQNMEVVGEGEIGKTVITRLFGKATPIIRYTGMDDWISISPVIKCSCGLNTPIIKGGVEGRVSASIILPDGRAYPAASFSSVGSVLNELKTQKVIQFQIIQKKINEIDILLIIDQQLRGNKPSLDVLFKKIKEKHQEKAGSQVKINVREAKPDEIKSTPGKPSPLVISNVEFEKGYKISNN